MSRRTSSRRERMRACGSPAEVVVHLCEEARVAISKADWPRAEAIYGRVIASGEADAGVYNNLATLYERQGIREGDVLELVARAHALAPQDEGIRKNHLNLLTRQVTRLLSQARYAEALPLAEERIRVDPGSAPFRHELGYAYARSGDLKTAIVHYTRAINLAPSEARYYNDLGLACYDLRLLAEAKGAFQQVLALQPDSPVAYVHLGLLANLTGLSSVAVNMLQRALEIDPACAEAHSNLALFLRDQGRQSECRRHYVRALELKPDSTTIFSSYLLSLNDDPHADPDWVTHEHRRFQDLVKETPRQIVVRDRSPEKRLRIAYLSPDFRQHSVAYFILPVIQAHDRSRVEVTCYFTGNPGDETTERIRVASDRWRSAYRKPDDELAELIVKDEIDVLVELSGHTCDNRLPMLARRVAPVQMTYLGYPNTTGLTEMDYRVTDAIADPPGTSDARCSERLLRIEGGFLAFKPAEWARHLPIVALPAERSGVLTFGSFNNVAKLNEGVLEAWAAILERVPDSVLLLKAKGLRDERVQERIRVALRSRGLDAESRVRMLSHAWSSTEHLSRYNDVDIALDTFPYNGTTTTCEALWMGAPVITLLGNSHAGRVGASLLSRVGLSELVCTSAAGYVEVAAKLANDRMRLKTLRSSLREAFERSPVMDARRLASELETAYGAAWRAHCRQQPSGERE